jgi:hypothetical protein
MDKRVEDFNRKQREAAKPRVERVIKLREAGETWEVIGSLMGVSRQRAQAIYSKAMADRSRKEIPENINGGWSKIIGELIAAGYTEQQIAGEAGLSQPTINRLKFGLRKRMKDDAGKLLLRLHLKAKRGMA